MADAPLEVIVCRQETGAAVMALTEGRLTGRPGICFVTRGPGATNAAHGVHIAAHDSAPMILFIGQVERAMFGRGALQVLISTEFSCASSTLMHETGYGPGDRLGGRFHFLVFDPGTDFDRTAQAYFGLSPRRDGFNRHARSPERVQFFWAVAPVALTARGIVTLPREERERTI